MLKKDRFNLEEDIMECWNLVNDLRHIIWAKFDAEDELSDDDLINLLQGLQGMSEIKFKKLFSTFESMVKEGKIK